MPLRADPAAPARRHRCRYGCAREAQRLITIGRDEVRPFFGNPVVKTGSGTGWEIVIVVIKDLAVLAILQRYLTIADGRIRCRMGVAIEDLYEAVRTGVMAAREIALPELR